MSTDITLGSLDTILASTAVTPQGLVAMNPLQAISLYKVISSTEVIAQVLDVSGNVVSHAGTALQVVSTSSAMWTLARLTDTKAIVIGGAVARIVEIVGSDLSLSSYYVVSPGTPTYPKIVRLSDTQALLVYNRLSQVRCVVLTITGTSVAAGSEYVVASPASFPTLAALSATQVLVTYNGVPILAEILDIAGTVVTVANAVATLDANAEGPAPVVRLSDTQATSIYRDHVSLNASAAVLNVSGSTITPGTPLTNVATDVYSGDLDAVALTDTSILVAYCDYNDGNKSKARILSDTGSTLGVVKVVGTSSDTNPMVAALTNAKAILTYRSSDNSFKAIVLETDPPTEPVEPPMPVPIPVITGIMRGGARIGGALPMFTGRMSGRLADGNSLVGTLPAITGIMRGGAQMSATLPAIIGVMSGQTTTAGALVGTLPMIVGVMRGSSSTVGLMSGRIPMFTGLMRGGGQLSGALPMITGLMTGRRQATGVLIGTLPMITGLMTGTWQTSGALVGDLPMFVPTPFGRLVGELPMFVGLMTGGPVVVIAYEAYAINLKPSSKGAVHEVTRYTGMPFTCVVRWKGDYYGWGPGGLYLMGGDTDYNAAVPEKPVQIPWDWMTTVTDFGSSQRKAMRQMTVGGRLGAKSSAAVSIGKPADFTYRYATAKGERAQNYRVKFGKGLDDRYYSIGLSGTGICDVDTIDFDVEPLSRK